MKPTVSINLCCYNSEKYLRETLDSIVNQTFKDWELIIIDDGSKDSTSSIIQEYVSQGYPIFYFYQENKGLGYSRNRALKQSSGQYIAFIDHDDIWLPDKLHKQMNVFTSRSDVDFIYTNYYKMISYNNNRLVKAFSKKQPEGFVFEKFIYNYQVFISTVVVSRKSLNSLDSLFDSSFNQIEEYDVFMRILYKHRAMYIDEVLAIYRYHTEMTTIKQPELLLREFPAMIEKFNEMDPIFEKLHPDILRYIDIKVLKYSKAKQDIIMGNLKDARSCISAHKWYNLKLLILFCATFMPKKLVIFLYHSFFFQKGKI